jgi:hypothetical protein
MIRGCLTLLDAVCRDRILGEVTQLRGVMAGLGVSRAAPG